MREVGTESGKKKKTNLKNKWKTWTSVRPALFDVVMLLIQTLDWESQMTPS